MPADLLAAVRADMMAPSQLEVVEGGDHSLEVSKRAMKARGETQAVVEKRVVKIIRIFGARSGLTSDH